MKKVISFTIAIVMISLCLIGSAESFSLRNDIQFGDKIEQVKEKEKLNLDTDKGTSLTYSGTVASYNGSIDYYFDESTGGLTDMLYEYNDFDNSSTSIDSIYNSLKDGIIRKYGSSLGFSGGTTHSITGKAFEDSLGMIFVTTSFFRKKADLIDYEEWFIVGENGAVKIDLVKYYFVNSLDEKQYNVLLSYHFASNEDIASLIQQKQEQRDSIDNDL